MTPENNFSKVCRTCLIEACNMKSIFSYEECLQPPATLCEMIMTCTSVQVMQGDGMPEQVCYNCANEVSRAFLFRKLCEKSDGTLRNYLNSLMPLKENQQQNVYDSPKESHFKEEMAEEKFNMYISKVELYQSSSETNLLDRDVSSDEVETKTQNKNHKMKSNETRKEVKGNGKKFYKCKICNESCAGLGNYRKHVTEFHSENMHKCEVCDKMYRTATLLQRHIESNHKQTIDSADQLPSLLTETTENKTTVEEKPLITNSKKSKQLEKKTGIVKTRNLPRTCTICNKTFRFNSNLERHKLIHTGERPFLCNVCGKGFGQLSYLKIHSFIHTGEKPYKCNMCERCFAAPGTLMTHIRTHTGERPHVCRICGKDFPQSGYLAAHIRTHTGEKPVECKVCHRRFNQSGRLIIHMRIHSGEKPYTCTECGRSFAVKGTLKKHIRTHTGERPYVCSVCGQAFAQSGTLSTHMKVHKPKQEVSMNLI